MFYDSNAISYRMQQITLKGKVADRNDALISKLLIWDQQNAINQRITINKNDIYLYQFKINQTCVQVKDKNIGENANFKFED